MELHTARSLMAVHGLAPATRRPGAATFSALLDAFRRATRAWIRHCRNQRDYARLESMSDHQLRDMGLTSDMIRSRMTALGRASQRDLPFR